MELFIIREGEQAGPYSADKVQSMLHEGAVREADMGWRKGLPAWLPLGEIFRPGSAPAAEPPPIGVVQSAVRQQPISARQKALLTFLGLTWPEGTTKEQAALLIGEALENPKLTSRFAKWGEEKIRSHADLFQDEIDYRRATRVQRYLEACQTDAADVVKGVTKAHVQVLMESLDKREPSWERSPKVALWDFLLPSMAEHFPQLLQPEWKGKLKFGGSPKIAASFASETSASGSFDLARPPAPGMLYAALRGLFYGAGALALGIGTLVLLKDKKETPGNPPPAQNNAATPGLPPLPPLPPSPGANGVDIGVVANAAPDDTPKPPVENIPPAAPAAPIPGLAAASAPTEPAPAAPLATPPAADPAMTPAAPVSPPPPTNPAFTPAPPPPPLVTDAPAPAPGVPAPGTPADPAMAQPPSGPIARDTATIVTATDVQLRFGKVTLTPGTRVKLIALEGKNARVNFNNNIVLVPVSATDIDPANTIVAGPTATPPVVVAPTRPAPAVPPPAIKPPTAPSSDL